MAVEEPTEPAAMVVEVLTVTAPAVLVAVIGPEPVTEVILLLNVFQSALDRYPSLPVPFAAGMPIFIDPAESVPVKGADVVTEVTVPPAGACHVALPEASEVKTKPRSEERRVGKECRL